MAGYIATLPMSVVMLAGHRMLPRSERYPLPPERIMARMADRSGVESATHGPLRDMLTTLSHFGFGALTGSLYTPFSRLLPLPPLLNGMIFGFLVWLVSYQGWIPRARILPPATKKPVRRNLLMVVAHFIWGGVLAWLVERWAKSS